LGGKRSILAKIRLFHLFTFQGYGTNFYSSSEYYEGEWYADRRSGWGRMYYSDGSVYEGEWYDDKEDGDGMLRLGKTSDTSHLFLKIILFWVHCSMCHKSVGKKT